MNPNLDGLFGPSPEMIGRQQYEMMRARAAQEAQMSDIERANYGMRTAGATLGHVGAGMLGSGNPAIEEAKMRESVMSQGGDLTTSAGLKAKAKQFMDRGDKVTAMKLVLAARDMEAQESKLKLEAARTAQEYTKAELDIAQAKKALRENPNLATATVGVKGRPGWKQLIIYDKTRPNDPYQEVGEPIESDKGTSVNVAAPVTPVTIQDPANPNATLIVDGRTGKTIGVGPKLTETGRGISKQMVASQGLGKDLQMAEDLLMGQVRDSEGNVTPGNKPTSSIIGKGTDFLGSVVGYAPSGANEAKSLEVVGGRLVQKVPRFEGPQSDKDVALYKSMAADVENASLPISTRLASLRTMREIYSGYEDGSRGKIIQDQLMGRGTNATAGKISPQKPKFLGFEEPK